MRKCIIYYSTVVDAGEGRWARQGEHQVEPSGGFGGDPRGKEPEFCCSTLASEMEKLNFSFQPGSDKTPMALQVRSMPYGGPGIFYCPFCGAKIIFKENLKLKVVETTVPRKTYTFEEV